LLGQCFLVGRDLIDLHDRIVIIVKVEQIWGDTYADSVAFAAVMVNFDPHDISLSSVSHSAIWLGAWLTSQARKQNKARYAGR